MSNKPEGKWIERRVCDLQCRFCGAVYEVETIEELGSIDYADDRCPECGLDTDEQERARRWEMMDKTNDV